MPETVTVLTGEIHDVAEVLQTMRDLDLRIAAADRSIGALKEDLKTARKHREGLITELRATVRGERALPFEPVAEGGGGQ